MAAPGPCWLAFAEPTRSELLDSLGCAVTRRLGSQLDTLVLRLIAADEYAVASSSWRHQAPAQHLPVGLPTHRAASHPGTWLQLTRRRITGRRRGARVGRHRVRSVTDTGDEWAPTEVEVQRDQQRAVKIVVAFILGITSAAGPVGAAVAGMTGPFFPNIVDKLRWRRVRNATETAVYAAETAGLDPEEFLDRAVSDDRRHELLARALIIAQDTALRAKRRGLGHSLAAGVMGDDAKIDEELLFMRAVADVDEWHIRLLGLLHRPMSAGFGGWSADHIGAADPGLAAGVLALLGTLDLHGLVATTISNRAIPAAVSSTTLYNITPAGRHFLGRLAADVETLAVGDRETE